jgi:ATP-dependent RNA helicase RhlE
VPEDYVHRIGRTGRAGNEGQAVSLVCVDERKLLGDIERLLKRDLSKVVIPGYEPDPSIRAEPIMQRSNSRQGARPGGNNGSGKRRGGGNGPRSGQSAGRGQQQNAAGASRAYAGKARRRTAPSRTA